MKRTLILLLVGLCLLAGCSTNQKQKGAGTSASTQPATTEATAGRTTETLRIERTTTQKVEAPPEPNPPLPEPTPEPPPEQPAPEQPAPEQPVPEPPAPEPSPQAQGGSAPPLGNACPPGYPVKGNVSSSGELIYHVQGGQFYNRTNPEQCFATEQAAQAAGYRRSQR